MIENFRFTTVKLFVFTMVTVVVTVWLASVIGNFRLFSSPYQVTAQFSDVTGLMNGDLVKAAGVTVGRVESISVRDGVAEVSLAIDEDVELPAALGAQIRFRNLVGQRMVALVERDHGPRRLLQAGDRISLAHTDPAFDLTTLFNGLRPLIRSTSARDINIVAQSLVQALRGRSDEVESILANLGSVADTLASRDGELSALLENVDVVAADLASRDAQLDSTLSDLNTFLSQMSQSRDDLSAALVTLDDAAQRFDRIVDRNDSNIRVELKDLATILDAVDDKRRDLRFAIRALPKMLVSVERVTGYGEWAMIHLVDVCKDDSGTCGTRALP